MKYKIKIKFICSCLKNGYIFGYNIPNELILIKDKNMKKLSLKLAFSTVVLGAFLVGCGDSDKFEAQEGRMDKQALEFVKEKYPNGIAYKTLSPFKHNKGEDITVTNIVSAFDRNKIIGYDYNFEIRDEKGNVLNESMLVNCNIEKNKCGNKF